MQKYSCPQYIVDNVDEYTKYSMEGIDSSPSTNEFLIFSDANFDTAIDAEKFCKEKSALFIVLSEEDLTKYFMVLLIQQLYREILAVADENGGKLENRVVFYADELGTLPP